MKCRKCGAETSESAKFCENCGAPVEAEVNETPAADETPVANEEVVAAAVEETVNAATAVGEASFAGTKETFSPIPEEPVKKKKPVMSINVKVNGKEIKLSGKSEYVFVDVFDYIDFDLQKVRGSKLITDLNGHKAEYMEPITSGADIVIRWEK